MSQIVKSASSFAQLVCRQKAISSQIPLQFFVEETINMRYNEINLNNNLVMSFYGNTIKSDGANYGSTCLAQCLICLKQGLLATATNENTETASFKAILQCSRLISGSKKCCQYLYERTYLLQISLGMLCLIFELPHLGLASEMHIDELLLKIVV